MTAFLSERLANGFLCADSQRQLSAAFARLRFDVPVHVRCLSILFLIGSNWSRRQCCPPCRPGSVGTLVLDARAAGFRGSSGVLGRRAGFAVLISRHNGGGRLALGLLPRTPQAPWASHNCVPSAHATSWPVHVRMWIPPGRHRRLRVRRRWKARLWPEPWQGHRQSQLTGKCGRGFTFKWCTHDPLPSLFHAVSSSAGVGTSGLVWLPVPSRESRESLVRLTLTVGQAFGLHFRNKAARGCACGRASSVWVTP